MIGYLAEIGKKVGFRVWVGMAEQGHTYRNRPLSDLSESELRVEGADDVALEHMRRVDVLWLQDAKARFAFEVEHTTQISEAIIRGSYFPMADIHRFFVVPRRREDLLHRKVNAPVFADRV